jgi:hypothetical protein
MGVDITHDRAERRIDVISTVLLALATLAIAWAGYQATRWHDEQALEQMAATKSRIESTTLADAANREAQVDITLFTQWVDARSRGDAELAGFYRDRFTSRFRSVFQAWISSSPFTNPNASPTPFAIPRYRQQVTHAAQAEQAIADTAAAQAAGDIHRADRYVLAVVLFAACLFFAGLCTRVRTVAGQVVVLGLGCILFLGTVTWVATFPVTVTT